MTTIPSSIISTASYKYLLCRLSINNIFNKTVILARSGGISGTGGQGNTLLAYESSFGVAEWLIRYPNLANKTARYTGNEPYR